MSIQEKLQRIVKAIKSGVSIYQIDPVGKGGSAKLLLQGRIPTNRKLNEMYTNLLLFEQNAAGAPEQEPQEGAAIPESYGEPAELLNQRMKKIQVILQADHSGMPHSVIDPVGGGNSVRRLLNGSHPTSRKVDEMYENILRFQQKQLAQPEPLFLALQPPDSPNNEQKSAFILQAVGAGIMRSHIDSAGAGKSIRRLENGQGVKQETLDLMYSKLLQLLGYVDSPENEQPLNSNKIKILSAHISSLQSLVSSLFEKVGSLETSLSVIQTHIQSVPKRTSMKILGATIMQKKNKVGGRSYRRWYGLYVDVHSKRRWIYIGMDLSKAKQKILAWFQKYPQDVHPIHLPSGGPV